MNIEINENKNYQIIDDNQIADEEKINLVNEITKLHFSTITVCLNAICTKCNGRSITTCKCAQTKYAKSITNEMIKRYMSHKNILKGKPLDKYVNLGK